MKIAILSKADASGGGASRVAEELAHLLNASSHTAHHYVAHKRPGNAAVRSLYGNFRFGRVFHRLNYYIKKIGFPELVPWELFLLHLYHINQYDVLHFHDISSAISPLTVRFLARKAPTVWTFHDCSPFTGGCLHPLDCRNYQTRCGNCPQLGEWPIDTRWDFTGFMQDIKRKTAQEHCFWAVVPSSWMVTQAMHSNMFIVPPHVIPNGLDIRTFKPLDKFVIRRKLNLPEDRFIILLTAAYLHDERKGIKYSLQALNEIAEINPYILLVGHIDQQTRSSFTRFDHFCTGYIADNRQKAEYFAAADLFISTSLAESFSLVTIETMATATPSVSFVAGGNTDLIQHNHTGYLVQPKDVAGLVTGINLALTGDRAAEWGRNARQRAEQLYSHEIFLKNHLALYEQVIRDFRSQ